MVRSLPIVGAEGDPVDKPKNEADRILSYAPGTPERQRLQRELEAVRSRVEEIPLVIDGRQIRTQEIYEVRCPHDHQRVLARAHLASEIELRAAIDAALTAHRKWSAMDSYHRAAVFLRAADLLAGPHRLEHIAAIMVNQSKTPVEAEIDLAEMVDFWRFNAYYLRWLEEQQPEDGPAGEFNRFDWRPLEGFVLAVPPFNFYSIAGNLPSAPAIAGNVALWKPARSTLLANYRIMQVLIEAGLPPGVVNFVPFHERHTDLVIGHPAFAGLHFTGSAAALTHFWQRIAQHLPSYRGYPRVVGETGGKDFIVVHPSADPEAVVANTIRGAFEYQGQKCSAASRLYAPESLWPSLRHRLQDELANVKIGPVEDLTVSMGAVITKEAYDKIDAYLSHARDHGETYTFVSGGNSDARQGWFISPTVIETKDPKGRLMTEEIFGPVLTVYVYPDARYEETLGLCDESTPYGLTGSIFAHDRRAITQAEETLRFTAGNFYINDKPTGAVVGRQPFGGARRSGTNDKAGFWLNLARWTSPRNIKETTTPARTWQRPYMG
ncbi:MAG: L-glutamate gamma-semialdehyde dehydrogenase [Chloroflexi bacterium]|nr:L-glutamate gamma-semialdehyde dehydrogenase [Chloroflexota bacterium]